MSHPLVEMIDAKTWYLDYVFNLNIEKGDFILIKGGNGSGKTTLIHLILGFVKPDQGSVKRYVKRFNYCPEKVYLPPHLSVLEYIEMLSAFKGVEVDSDLVHMLKLPLYKKISACSKGNLQKVCLYQALIGPSELYILDEPFSGLDDKMAKALSHHIQMLHQQSITLIISTHFPEYFADVTKKVVHL